MNNRHISVEFITFEVRCNGWNFVLKNHSVLVIKVMQNEQQIGSNDHFPGFFPNLVFYEILLQRDSYGEHMQKSMVEFYGSMA